MNENTEIPASVDPTKISYNPVRLPIDINDQSEILIGSEVVRVSKLTNDSRDGNFMKFIYDDAKTLYEVFRRGVRESNNGPCLGWRDSVGGKPFQWLQYNEALLRAQNFGAGLASLGLDSKTLVAIYSQNCPEWILTEQGLYCQSMIIVPLYDTLGPEASTYILSQANISTVVCQDERKLVQLLGVCPRSVRLVVMIKNVSNETKAKAKKLGIDIKTFEQVEAIGATSNKKEVPPKPSDICTICYTSGTTGTPKGVMLSHSNVVASVSSALMQLAEYKPRSSDVMLSFLPLAHMLERSCEVGMYMVGGAVGFSCGDIKHLEDDYRTLRPTISPSVPRLLNRAYDKFMASTTDSFFRRLMLRMALSSKKAQIERFIIKRISIWDKLVFKKIQDGMGGRLRLLVVGSAPLAGNVLLFMRCALGCIIVEGYGQTECAAVSTLTFQGDSKPEHVGVPLSCNAIKLIDVPDMNYFASRGQGEICIRGANVFQGYFKDPEKTKESIDSNGWLHTGDVGQWLSNGTLKIIDRRKHIFKISQGEYIVPEKIENIYIRSPFVHQIFVHGESLKSVVVGIVVPNVEVVKTWAKKNGIDGTLSVLCSDSYVKELILSDIQEKGREYGLKSFEQVKDVYLHPDPFSVQNGLLTPALQTKRPELRKYFKPQIDDLYTNLEKTNG